MMYMVMALGDVRRMRNVSSRCDWPLRTGAPGPIPHPNLAYKTGFGSRRKRHCLLTSTFSSTSNKVSNQFGRDAEIFSCGPLAVLLDDGGRSTNFRCRFRCNFRFPVGSFNEQSATRTRFPPFAVGHGQRIRQKDFCRPPGVPSHLGQWWSFNDLAGGAVGEKLADRRNPPEEIRRCGR